MKTLVAITVLLSVGLAQASAAPILSISGRGLSAASTAEADFLNSVHSGFLTETFDDNSFYSVGVQSTKIVSSTGIGGFSTIEVGYGGLCDSGPYACDSGIAVLNATESPFSGRFAVSGGNWLDSMDARQMDISLAKGFNSIGFYITDPNDAGGRLSVGGVDFEFDNIFGSGQSNGRIFYVSLFDQSGLGDISIFSNNSDDGYGIDNVTVANVTEPGTVSLLVLGLFGIALAVKRRGRG
ncbi:MAG: hypothetical protein ACX933_00980 [Marinobacter adhaerens]